MKHLFTFFLILCFASPALAATETSMDSPAKQAIVVDYNTGTVLYEKNADERMPTSSMSKVITMLEVFDGLKTGQINLDQTFTVSEKAWRMGGSKMFVEVGKQVRVEDLIRGVIVQSGNDATVVLAEGLAGSEGAFADHLNARAKELGMTNSHFMNASGWPDEDHYSTARDLSILAAAIIRRYPEYYPYYSEKEFTFNDIKQGNRNPLLYRNIGADGIKTGHTEAGGYGLIGSGVQTGRRVIVVVNGLENMQQRADESARLLEWGLQRFSNHVLFAKGQSVEEIPVVMGTQTSLGVTVPEDLLVTVPNNGLEKVKITLEYNTPLIAPLQAAQQIGTVKVEVPDLGIATRSLVTSQAVERQGFFAAALSKIKFLLGLG